MNHLGLFEGIGGFSLAARWAGWHTVAWCEINPFCQTVLKYHFPNATAHEDIKETDFTVYRGRIDIITGGFPCQPYSTAGKRLGKEDERHLWPEMLRAIREVQPRWVVGENVAGLINWSGGWFSTRCRLTWKLKATPYKRLYFQLQVSTLRTDETESGLLHTQIWPTPTSVQRDHPERVQKLKLAGAETMMSRKAGDNRPNSILDMAMFVGLLPTPTVMDTNQGDLSKVDARRARAKQKKKNGNGFGVTIGELANRGMLPTPQTQGLKVCDRNGKTQFMNLSLLPTPQARDEKNGSKITDGRTQRKMQQGWSLGLNDLAVMSNNGTTSQLNPQFVSEMMGFPTDWTELPFQSGETNQSKPTGMQSFHK